MKKAIKIILGILAVFIIIGIVAGGDDEEPEETGTEPAEESPEEEGSDEEGTDDGEEPAEEEPAEEPEEEEAEEEEPVLTLTAEELITAYEENEVRANSNYKDRVLEVTGVIDNISHHEDFSEYYTISIDTGADFEMVSIRVEADMDFEEDLMELNKEETVTVQFLCEGYVAGLYIDGELIEIVK